MDSQRFNCSVQGCKKDYCNQFNLKRHYESQHLGVKRFRCKVCKKYLSSKQNLKEHRFMHTGEKPYNCSYPGCAETFRQGSQLSLHKKIHEEVNKRFKIEPRFDICLKALTIVLTKDQDHKDFEEYSEFKIEASSLPLISTPQVGVILPSSFITAA